MALAERGVKACKMRPSIGNVIARHRSPIRGSRVLQPNFGRALLWCNWAPDRCRNLEGELVMTSGMPTKERDAAPRWRSHAVALLLPRSRPPTGGRPREARERTPVLHTVCMCKTPTSSNSARTCSQPRPPAPHASVGISPGGRCNRRARGPRSPTPTDSQRTPTKRLQAGRLGAIGGESTAQCCLAGRPSQQTVARPPLWGFAPQSPCRRNTWARVRQQSRGAPRRNGNTSTCTA